MKRFLKIIISAALILLVGYLLIPQYLKKALIYTTADIDDYQLFPNRTVEGGEYDPWPLSTQYNMVELPTEYRQKIEDYKSVAFLIIKEGSVFYEEYWSGYSENSLSNSFSMAKSIVGLLVMKALEEGYIESLDDPVGKYVDEYSTGSKSTLILRDVLTMSSGLNWDEHYASPFSVTTKAYYGTELDPLVMDLEVVEEPGNEFKYLSGNTLVLAYVIVSATGKTLSEYASEVLWSKIGSRYDALWSLDHKNGMEKAYCCFNTNARDFARIGQLVLNHGKWNNFQVIDSALVSRAVSPADYLVDSEFKDEVDFYGFHWWIMNYRGQTIPYCRGLNGQYIFVMPDLKAVVVRLGHKRSLKKISHHTEDAYMYIDAALALLE